MKPSTVVVALAGLIAALALVAAGAGLFWNDPGARFAFTTLRGQTVQIYGQGLYRYDTVFSAAGNKGTDAVTLLFGIPLLLLAAVRYRRGSLRGGLLLMGMLLYFLYVYASLGLNTAYNSLFLVYVALFSASLFAFVLALMSFDLAALPSHFLLRLPRRVPALFLIASGLVTMIVWLTPLVGALAQGRPPALLDSYSTKVTDTLDIGIITPACFVLGRLMLRRAPLGYLLACPLLVLEAMLLPMLVAQTVTQLAAGVTFAPGEIVGPIGGFGLVALLAIGVLATLLAKIKDTAPLRAAYS